MAGYGPPTDVHRRRGSKLSPSERRRMAQETSLRHRKRSPKAKPPTLPKEPWRSDPAR